MKDGATAAQREPGMAADFVAGLRMGSFTDLEVANRFVNATLLRNRLKIDRIVEGKASRAALDALFGWETGKEAFAPDGRTDPQIRQTYGVRVVIVADDRTPKGFRSIPRFPEISTRRRRRRNTKWIFIAAPEWR